MKTVAVSMSSPIIVRGKAPVKSALSGTAATAKAVAAATAVTNENTAVTAELADAAKMGMPVRAKMFAETANDDADGVCECICAGGESGEKKGFDVWLEELNAPWREILHLGSACQFAKNHVEPGNKMRGFYFITSGRVRLSYFGEMGEERRSLYLGPGCIFNEIPALGRLNYSVGFSCLEHTEARRFESALLVDKNFIAAYPHLIANLLCSMAKKSSIFFMHLAAIRCVGSMARLCAVLLQLATARTRTNMHLSQSDAAELLGLHQTTVARLIRKLRHKGIIGRFTKTELQVLDMERLRSMAGFEGTEVSLG